ncbi:MAG: NfeD family protein [Bacteroidales bacterium]|nr:NfeD family protein [Bacteroidales bacterium]
MFSELWTSLSPFMKVIWSITLIASLIFIIQTVMTFIGADTGGDLDVDAAFDTDVNIADVDGTVGAGGVNLYTFRNFVNFFLGFGWTAVLLSGSIASRGLLLLISVLVGIAFVAMVMYLFKWLYSMQQTGNINVYKTAVGCTGTVYLNIPAERSGEGKVQITIQGAVREYNALTEGDALPTGTPIKVVEVVNPSTLLVEPLNSLII